MRKRSVKLGLPSTKVVAVEMEASGPIEINFRIRNKNLIEIYIRICDVKAEIQDEPE